MALVTAAATVSGHDYSAPGKPRIAWDDETARAALVDGLVRDATAVLAAVAAGEPPTEGAAADAVGLLALVAGQDVERVPDPDNPDDPGGDPGGGGRWRIARPVAADRVISTVDSEAGARTRRCSGAPTGFTAHVVVEPDTGLITATRLTAAAGAAGAANSDATVGIALLATDDTIAAGPVQGAGPSAARCVKLRSRTRACETPYPQERSRTRVRAHRSPKARPLTSVCRRS